MKNNKSTKSPTSSKGTPKKNRRIGLIIFMSLVVIAALICIVMFVPFGKYDFSAAPTTSISTDGNFEYRIPLDPASPWAKFRANDLQNGRTPVEPAANDLEPWSYRTGKGIFSSPVVDGDGYVYVGSADTYFYCFNPDGSVKWSVKNR